MVRFFNVIILFFALILSPFSSMIAADQSAAADAQANPAAVSEHGENISTGEIPGEDHATLEQAEDKHKSDAFDLNEVINHHLGDSKLWHFELSGFDLSITKRVVMMWIAVFFLLIIVIPAARSISKNVYRKPGRFTGLLEVFVNFIRNDVGHSTMGHHSHSYEPFLLTLFFFILFLNLIGLIPSLGEIAVTAGHLVGYDFHTAPGETALPLKLWPGITPTGDLSVTATLAIISFLAIQLSGFIYQGVAYIKNIVPGGVPFLIWPIMWPIELLGQFTKPFALAIRLLANMTAGHMIILVFLGFIFQFQQIAIVPVSVSISIAIYMLEIFVGFLQAYIFTFLTALFIAGSQHRH